MANKNTNSISRPQIFLEDLRLKNFATFDDQEICFGAEFNAIIGETGSGKSLILDGIELLLGQRADKKVIRRGLSFASIEASFRYDDAEIRSFFEEHGFLLEEDTFLVKRILYANGRSKAFINIQQCPLQLLSNFSRKFVDLIGQFENQKLLRPSYQLELLDKYAGNAEDKKNYQEAYQALKNKQDQLSQKIHQSQEMERRREFLDFQKNQIDELSPSYEDEKTLLENKLELELSEKRQDILQEMNDLLNGGSSSLPGLLQQLQVLLKLKERLDPSFQKTLDFPEDISHQLSDLSFEVEKVLSKVPDLQELETIRVRLDSYQKLKRKFGDSSLEGLLNYYQEISDELSELDHLDQDRSILEQEIEKLGSEAKKLAKVLTKGRHEAAKRLEKQCTGHIRSLQMKGASVEFRFQMLDQLSEHGQDSGRILAETNPGEGYFPIDQIASGGELSRILLALRQIVSDKDSISIFLFDEIDAGIGGPTAISIGEALQRVARSSQVIAITHLPQIAQFAQQIISVSKKTIRNRTYSQAKEMGLGAQRNLALKEMIAFNLVNEDGRPEHPPQ